MDLVYIPEVLTYGSFRSPQYRDYEQPWNRNYFSCDKITPVQCKRSQQSHNYQQQKSLSKESCHLCKESKRRSLATYIRSKSRRDSCQEIYEEEEEISETVRRERKVVETGVPSSSTDAHKEHVSSEVQQNF